MTWTWEELFFFVMAFTGVMTWVAIFVYFANYRWRAYLYRRRVAAFERRLRQ